MSGYFHLFVSFFLRLYMHMDQHKNTMEKSLSLGTLLAMAFKSHGMAKANNMQIFPIDHSKSRHTSFGKKHTATQLQLTRVSVSKSIRMKVNFIQLIDMVLSSKACMCVHTYTVYWRDRVLNTEMNLGKNIIGYVFSCILQDKPMKRNGKFVEIKIFFVLFC